MSFVVSRKMDSDRLGDALHKKKTRLLAHQLIA
jgi:hypothetical protein